MQIAGTLRKYCPKCRQHQEHKVSIYKKGKNRTLAEGARRQARKTKGYGSFPKPIQKRFAKTTKKTVLLYKCQECGHTIQTKGLRLKKVDIARA